VAITTGSSVRERVPADLLEHLQPVHAGHADVEQHEVERSAVGECQPLGAIGRFGDGIASGSQPSRERVAIRVGVVNDKQRGLGQS
jgi:hypothetical protein